MEEKYLLLSNALIYTLTLFIFIKKRKLSVGHIVWGLFTLSAWASYGFVQQPNFIGSVHDNLLTWQPLIYLYIVLLIFFLPLFKYDKLPYFKRGILIPKFNIWKWVMFFCIGFQILSFFVNLPNIKTILNADTMALADYRDNVYDGSNSVMSSIPLLNRFSLVYSGMRTICVASSIFLFLCYKKHRKIVTIFLITSMADVVMQVIIMVSRGIMVSYMIYIVTILVFLRDYISSKAKKIMVLYCIPIVIVAFSAFWAISVSRFGDLANFMMFKYLGEPMVNFDGLLFDNLRGETWGRSYFNVIYRYLFGEIDFMNAEEKWDFMEKVTGVRSQYFYTFVGGIMYEVGKVGTVIVAFILNRILNRVAVLKTPYCFNYSFIWFLLFYFYTYGLFLFALQDFEGNFMILYSILFYFIFKYRPITYKYNSVLKSK